jgi:hypothetical protein
MDASPIGEALAPMTLSIIATDTRTTVEMRIVILKEQELGGKYYISEFTLMEDGSRLLYLSPLAYRLNASHMLWVTGIPHRLFLRT